MTRPAPDLSPDQQNLIRDAVNALRALSFDAVEKAKSGHPGMPMGAADLAFVLWTKFLRHDPSRPNWIDRDRFVLSAGHGSALLYSLLHLTGYREFTIEELKKFRQWGARTAGHPEYGLAPGIETTTGPLGQGVANAVGMAIARQMLAARVNTDGAQLITHTVWCLCSDGDLMEGVAAEACSLAGHLQVGTLVLIYDDNGISIDGSTELSFSGENVDQRFESYGWHVQAIDGHDHAAIEAALLAARQDPRPSIIRARTTIGFGAPTKQGTAGVHGSPLGAEETAAARQALGWQHPPFHVPDNVRAVYAASVAANRESVRQWETNAQRFPAQAARLRAMVEGDLPIDLAASLPTFDKSMATRKAGEAALNAIAARVPQLVGGSADLTGSTNTFIKGAGVIQKGDFSGRNFHWGVREHAMAGICNGIALHGGFIPYGASFLVFTDYCRPSIRLSALMGLRVIHVMTHDSIFLGEDGPTHQPIEHLEALRAIPDLNVLRPDLSEVGQAWIAALRHHGPSIISLTRQNLPVLNNPGAAEGVARGAYIVAEAAQAPAVAPELIIIATGSELHLATGAAEALAAEGRRVRVVSMVSEFLFDQQTQDYQRAVLMPGVKRLAVEAGCTRGWRRWVGLEGDVVGIDTFGRSAPAEKLAEEFGFTVDNVVKRARTLLG